MHTHWSICFRKLPQKNPSLPTWIFSSAILFSKQQVSRVWWSLKMIETIVVLNSVSIKQVHLQVKTMAQGGLN